MPYRRIVIGVDFATASLAAVRWVASTFGRRARMLLVHVAPDPRLPAFLKQLLPAVGVRHTAPNVYQGLQSLADLADRAGVEVDIFTGSPAEGLAVAAEEFNADLICVGKSRRRRGSGRFGATTPLRLLSRTPLPVLVVPENPKTQPIRVLAAVNDGSERMHVLQSAAQLACAWDARLDACHVIEPELHALAQKAVRRSNTAVTGHRAADHLGAVAIHAVSDARLCLLAREWLADQAAELKIRKERLNPIARLGDAGEEIIGHAVRSDTALIVLGRGSAERGTAGGAVPGSTARLATWVAPCPVLVLGAQSASSQQRAGVTGWRDGAPSREAPALTLTARMASTDVRSSSRPGPDGGDAA
jgi:nucleotide-binding universal stress UspA family protein